MGRWGGEREERGVGSGMRVGLRRLLCRGRGSVILNLVRWRQGMVVVRLAIVKLCQTSIVLRAKKWRPLMVLGRWACFRFAWVP